MVTSPRPSLPISLLITPGGNSEWIGQKYGIKTAGYSYGKGGGRWSLSRQENSGTAPHRTTNQREENCAATDRRAVWEKSLCPHSQTINYQSHERTRGWRSYGFRRTCRKHWTAALIRRRPRCTSLERGASSSRPKAACGGGRYKTARCAFEGTRTQQDRESIRSHCQTGIRVCPRLHDVSHKNIWTSSLPSLQVQVRRRLFRILDILTVK